MMKKTTGKKLVLRAESLKNLTRSALETAAGGATNQNGTLYCTRLIGCDSVLCGGNG